MSLLPRSSEVSRAIDSDGGEISDRSAMTQEREEAQLRRAEMEANKADNMLSHEKEIMARPKREWFQTTKDKATLKKRMSEASSHPREAYFKACGLSPSPVDARLSGTKPLEIRPACLVPVVSDWCIATLAGSVWHCRRGRGAGEEEVQGGQVQGEGGAEEEARC